MMTDCHKLHLIVVFCFAAPLLIAPLVRAKDTTGSTYAPFRHRHRRQILLIRGGNLYGKNGDGPRDQNKNKRRTLASSPVELNPSYVPPTRLVAKEALRLQDVDDHGNLVSPPSSYYIETQTFSYESGGTGQGINYDDIRTNLRKPASVLSSVRRYLRHLYQVSGPSLSYTAVACVGVFILWQVPACTAMLRNYFVCSSRNLQSMRIISLLLSAISHAAPLHLVFNLLALLSIGPSVKRMLFMPGRWPVWPLLLGSAFAGSLSFLCLDGGRYHDGCMGLSGVTLAILAVYARFLPSQPLGLLIGGIIPVRLPASQLLNVILAWSIAGTFLAARHSRVAHSTHLGGLLFGMMYFEAWARRDRIRSQLRRLKDYKRP